MIDVTIGIGQGAPLQTCHVSCLPLFPSQLKKEILTGANFSRLLANQRVTIEGL